MEKLRLNWLQLLSRLRNKKRANGNNSTLELRQGQVVQDLQVAEGWRLGGVDRMIWVGNMLLTGAKIIDLEQLNQWPNHFFPLLQLISGPRKASAKSLHDFQLEFGCGRAIFDKQISRSTVNQRKIHKSMKILVSDGKSDAFCLHFLL